MSSKANDQPLIADIASGPRKKRKYSRNGCKECKRRKLKCDESKPKCWNCAHLSKDCTYERKIKFTNSRSFTIELNTSSMNNKLIDLNTKEKLAKKKELSISSNASVPTALVSSPSVTISSENVFTNQALMIVQNPPTPLLGILDIPFDPNIPAISSSSSPALPIIHEQSEAENQMRKQTLFNEASTLATTDKQQSIELDNTLFTGASNLISDLNDLIQTFGTDFDSQLDFLPYNVQFGNLRSGQLPQQQQSQQYNLQYQRSQLPRQQPNFTMQQNMNNGNVFQPQFQNGQQQQLQPHFQQGNSGSVFGGISPTDYSVHSNETPPLDEDVRSSNEDYIKRLVKSLKTDFSPSPGGIITEPTASQHPGGSYNLQRSSSNTINTFNNPKGLSSFSMTKSHTFSGNPSEVAPIYQEMEAPANPREKDNDAEPTQLAFPPPPPDILMSDSKEKFEYLYTLNKSISQQDLADLATFFQWPVSSSHMGYMKIFITKIHMNVLPFTTSFLHNSFIKCFLLQAKSSPHLLFALLSISARYESYQMSRLQDKDESVKKKIKYHNKMRSYYLSSCLKSLDAILHSRPRILDNIESLLLTILILASDYAASTGSQWRAHLRGAKDLLIKYCTFKPTSLALAMIWIWFYSMETLAGLTAPSGGNIREFDELIKFLDLVKSTGRIGHTLETFGFLEDGYYDDDDGNVSSSEAPRSKQLEDWEHNSGEPTKNITIHCTFNLYLGYNDDVMDVLREIVLVLEATRWYQNKEKANADDPSATSITGDQQWLIKILNDRVQIRNTQIMKISSMIEKARSFKIMNNLPPYNIPTDSLYHPLNLKGYHYNNPKGSHIVMSNYIHNTNPQTRSSNDFENWYSWADLSQQLYSDASLLKLLTAKYCYGVNGLPIDNGMIQDVVDRMILGLSSLIQFNADISESDLKELDDYYNKTDEEVALEREEKDDDNDDSENDIGAVVDANDSESPNSKANDNDGDGDDNDIEIDNNEASDDKEDVTRAANGGSKIDDRDSDHHNDAEAAVNKKGNISIPEASNINHFNKTSANTSISTINFDKYLFYQFDNRLVMIQWPLLVCGLCSIQPRQKLIIDCCFNALMNLGVGSGEMSMMKLQRLWNLEKAEGFDYASCDIYGDENDSVPFM